ncbi:MAG: 4-hydroxy-tetrahydrodipicolinate reductase [Treponema sp.]|jgi:4-hydroxy-tetrahydrodipicolinate reductase|nr:4-hydroxy-tetrahydrodipicolinate reductase [Treponema sp.]
MNAALIGYGKMGRLLERMLQEKGHRVLAVADPFAAGEKTALGVPVLKSAGGLAGFPPGTFDAAIEFTRPDAAAANITALAELKIPVVTGTTGWYDRLPEITGKVNAAGSALFWAPNFSLGMNLFYRLAAYAARLFDPFPEYDAGGFECHHNKKADSPSGTAKILAKAVLSNMTRKTKAVYEMLDRPPLADEFHYASLRVGSVPGTHSIIFDSPADAVEITHTVRNREGLAAGAVTAAEWLVSKPRSGIFTMDEMLADMLA